MNYESAEGLAKIVEESISKAESLQSKIPAEVANMRGMSSPKIRHLLNNLCSYGPCVYLEIGTYSGSTLVPALYQNNCHGYAIDNWSQFKEDETGWDAQKAFRDNLFNYAPNFKECEVISDDCFNPLTYERCYEPNVFFYDGAHDAESTERAIKLYGVRTKGPFILVVDDYNLTPEVSAGTEEALKKFTVYACWQLKQDYHMGLGVFVLEAK